MKTSSNRCRSWNFVQTLTELVKFGIVVSCALVLVLQAKSCLTRYLSHETTAIIALKSTGEAPFLSFTFCPDFKVAYNREKLTEYGMPLSDYQRGVYIVKNATSDLQYREIFEDVVLGLEDLLYEVGLETWTPDQPYVDIPINGTLDPRVGHWRKKHYVSYGYCFSLELSPDTSALGISELHVSGAKDIFIYLHHNGQFLAYDTISKVGVTAGYYLFVDLNYEVTVDTLGHESSFPCSDAMSTGLDDCLYHSAYNLLADEYNCSIPFLPDYGPEPICDPNTAGRDAIARYNKLRTHSQEQLCERPCTILDVFTGMPFISPLNEGPDRFRIKVYLKTSTKVKKTVLDYTVLSMLAEIGGYTGLLLGISIVHMTTVLDKICIHVVHK